MDRIAASALKRLVRDNLALQLQESSDSSRVEAAIRSIVSETDSIVGHGGEYRRREPDVPVHRG